MGAKTLWLKREAGIIMPHRRAADIFPDAITSE